MCDHLSVLILIHLVRFDLIGVQGTQQEPCDVRRSPPVAPSLPSTANADQQLSLVKRGHEDVACLAAAATAAAAAATTAETAAATAAAAVTTTVARS